MVGRVRHGRGDGPSAEGPGPGDPQGDEGRGTGRHPQVPGRGQAAAPGGRRQVPRADGGAVKGTKKRDKLLRLDLEAKWQNAAFQAILCDYYLAQTYEDPKDPQRREMLEKAAKEFDDIFQASGESEIGVYAHMWQGKTVMELGDDPELAKDIFDEVLANFETGGGVVFTASRGRCMRRSRSSRSNWA